MQNQNEIKDQIKYVSPQLNPRSNLILDYKLKYYTYHIKYKILYHNFIIRIFEFYSLDLYNRFKIIKLHFNISKYYIFASLYLIFSITISISNIL